MTNKRLVNVVVACLIALMALLSGDGKGKFDMSLEFQPMSHGLMEHAPNAVHVESEKGHLSDQEMLVTDRSFFSSSQSFSPRADDLAQAKTGLSPPLRPPRLL